MVAGVSVAPFTEGERPYGAPHELISCAPESPLERWPHAEQKALLLVAHPDDEALFAGGLMLEYTSWEWHVWYMTGDEARRAQAAEWARLAQSFGLHINQRFFEFEDRYRSGDRRLWLARLAQEDTTSWDIVFTHGYRGEYGHHHHVWCHLAAHMLYENVWDFLHPCWRVKQLRKTLVREVPYDERKVNTFRLAYGEIAEGLEAHAPWITQPQLEGDREFFTQAILGL